MSRVPPPDRRTEAQRRWESLTADAPREAYFDALRDVLRESYLAEEDNPYRQSGRSSGARRWDESRRPIAEAVDRDGDFLDVGCANGLLLQSLIAWCGERGRRIRPHGVDFIPELIDLARRRHPGHEASFHVANACLWVPPRRYDFVRTELVYVPPADRRGYARRLLDDVVAPDGRLLVCAYWGRYEPPLDVVAELTSFGLTVRGRATGPGVDVAWVEAPRRASPPAV